MDKVKIRCAKCGFEKLSDSLVITPGHQCDACGTYIAYWEYYPETSVEIPKSEVNE